MWRCYLRLEALDESGRGSGNVVDVVDTSFALGRDAERCNVVLPHADVEPVHARIDVDPDNPNWRVFVRTGHPASGADRAPGGGGCARSRPHPPMTILNGFPLWRAQPLHRGDVLSLGPFDVALVDAGVVLHTGERLSLCAARVDEVQWQLLDAKIKADYAWYTQEVLHRPSRKQKPHRAPT